jgi:hypothetical protein
MERLDRLELQSFIYPTKSYHGPFQLDALIFNANLQEFAQRVSYISSLQINGKLSPEESFNRISELWEKFESSKTALGIGTDTEN